MRARDMPESSHDYRLYPAFLAFYQANRTKQKLASLDQTEVCIALLSNYPKSEVYHSDLGVFDDLSLSLRLFLALRSMQNDLDLNPKLCLLAASTAYVDEIMTRLSAWLLGPGCSEIPGKKYFQTCPPSAGVESKVLAVVLHDI